MGEDDLPYVRRESCDSVYLRGIVCGRIGDNGEEVMGIKDIESMDIFEIQELMERRGYWMELKSPFNVGENWACGFTALGCSGWNGRPDYQGFAKTAQEAAVNAVLEYEKSTA